ncbi:40S ribosomal protein S24-1, putative [Entamoeba invadens IP1]|uniref:40S ribosomal protein S24-1, putative n=1 Tax=Entamoeba invadens IP1 TaxID=370355 RepID=UPI0002C3CE70|nr:40S ribosomal protein S24-1, putative [Entamoeba invadens IP1]ELP93304.1 40S ribosomal protein S24-1, putative [Entamoeba invadens IP1]|eukprot:XP_004260075.1 40S ribosomal protein S24-1, putative [Entamoeba invadens IP1]
MAQKAEVTIRTRNLLVNPLLNRKQVIVDVYHPGVVQPKSQQIREMVAKVFKVKDPQTIVLSGFMSKFGGGKTTGFAMIYDTLTSMKRYSAKYVLIKAGMEKKTKAPRKQRKEIKKKWRMCHSLKDYKRKEMKKASRKKK